MRDISLHILDIVMNSIAAKASLINITVIEETEIIKVIIKDNGYGMDKKTLGKVLDPFYTKRTTRKVGLGLPLFCQNVKKTGGRFRIDSSKNDGTFIEATFNRNHIDCIPLGNIKETIISLIMIAPDINYLFIYKKNDNEYVLDTIKIKQVLEDVPINDINVINWLKKDLVNLESL